MKPICYHVLSMKCCSRLVAYVVQRSRDRPCTMGSSFSKRLLPMVPARYFAGGISTVRLQRKGNSAVLISHSAASQHAAHAFGA